MIILFHPRATKPRNCRLPLAVLALAAVLEGREEYEIVDGNLEDKPVETMLAAHRHRKGRAAGSFRHARSADGRGDGGIEREIRRLRPQVKIVVGRILSFDLSRCRT